MGSGFHAPTAKVSVEMLPENTGYTVQCNRIYARIEKTEMTAKGLSIKRFTFNEHCAEKMSNMLCASELNIVR